jgi:hypothetical protein
MIEMNIYVWFTIVSTAMPLWSACFAKSDLRKVHDVAGMENISDENVRISGLKYHLRWAFRFIHCDMKTGSGRV